MNEPHVDHYADISQWIPKPVGVCVENLFKGFRAETEKLAKEPTVNVLDRVEYWQKTLQRVMMPIIISEEEKPEVLKQWQTDFVEISKQALELAPAAKVDPQSPDDGRVKIESIKQLERRKTDIEALMSGGKEAWRERLRMLFTETEQRLKAAGGNLSI